MEKYINPHGIRKLSIIISLIHNKAILYKTEKNKILCFIQNQITQTYRGSEQLPNFYKMGNFEKKKICKVSVQ